MLSIVLVLIIFRPVHAKNTTEEPVVANINIDLKSQLLTTALIALGREAQVNVLFSGSNTSNIYSKKISGRFALKDIVAHLLQNTDLIFRFVDARTIVIDKPEQTSRESMANVGDADGTVNKQTTEKAIALSKAKQGAYRTEPVNDLSSQVVQGFDGIEKIVVTGSRLKRGGKNTNVPITLIDQSYINLAGTSGLADTLLGLSALSPNPFSGANSQAQTSGGAGLNFLDLRGLGFERTLVLVNGRRHVGSRRGTSAININTIPEALIQRVEISTGGGSAVYGADAISGTVNFVLIDDFAGTKIDTKGAFSSRADAEQGKISITTGADLNNGAGHLIFSGIYEKTQGVEATDRSYASDGLNTLSNPDNSEIDDAIPNFIHSENVRFNAFALPGAFNLRGNRLVFNDDGNGVRPFDFGLIGSRGGRQVGGDGVLFEVFDNLRFPLQRSILSSLFRYDVNDTHTVFFEGKYAHTKSSQLFQPVTDSLLPIYADNPFIPEDLQGLLGGDPATSLDDIDRIFVSKVHTEFGRRGTRNQRDTLQLVTGLRGDITADWQYEMFATYGQTKEKTLSLNSRVTQNFFDSIDAVTNPATGDIICRNAAARAQGCLPLNILGTDNATSAAINYSRVDLTSSELLRQTTAGASFNGELAQLQAGPISAAIGIEYRKEYSLRQSSDLQASGQTFLPEIPSNTGQYSVYEGYVETRIPWITNAPFAKELSTEFALRLSDYDTSGTETAWHGIINYAPTASLRFRAVKSRSVRAPNINELFALRDSGFQFLDDTCDAFSQNDNPARASNCQALGLNTNFDGRNSFSKRIIFSGNTALKAETANTHTLGVVITPESIPSLSVTADFWKVDLTDTINNPNAQAILENCIDSELTVTENPFCRLIERDSETGLIASILSQSTNIGQLVTSGTDFDINYQFPINRYITNQTGIMKLRLFGTYLDKIVSIANSLAPDDSFNFAGIGTNPRLQFNAYISVSDGPFLAGWYIRMIGSSQIVPLRNLPNDQFDLPETGTETFHNIFFEYSVNDKLKLSVNLNNIFDNKPPRRAFNIKQGRGNGGLYPNLGANFSFAASYHFD